MDQASNETFVEDEIWFLDYGCDQFCQDRDLDPKSFESTCLRRFGAGPRSEKTVEWPWKSVESRNRHFFLCQGRLLSQVCRV